MGGDKFTIVGDCGLRNIVVVNDNQGQIMNETMRSDGSPNAAGTSLMSEDFDLKKSMLFLQLDYAEIIGDPLAFGPKEMGFQAEEGPFLLKPSKYYYKKPVVVSTSRDPVFQKNAHLSKDLKMILFNEKLQVTTAVTLHEVFRKSDEKRTNCLEVEDLSHVKIDMCLDSLL